MNYFEAQRIVESGRVKFSKAIVDEGDRFYEVTLDGVRVGTVSSYEGISQRLAGCVATSTTYPTRWEYRAARGVNLRAFSGIERRTRKDAAIDLIADLHSLRVRPLPLR